MDAALGLQKLGHKVDIYTSHHDPQHCFEETIDGMSCSGYAPRVDVDDANQLIGTLTVHAPKPPFPRSFKGKLHILFANARQLHLITHLLRRPEAKQYDVYFVDQLSTCVPFLREFSGKRVVFYCHFPDKLLADGAYVEGQTRRGGGLLKRLYRYPVDKLEEITTSELSMVVAVCWL